MTRPKTTTDVPRPYDLSIHTNPDAAAWARFFVETWTNVHPDRPAPDEGWMLGWFANAMMAMHDHLKAQAAWPRDAQRKWIEAFGFIQGAITPDVEVNIADPMWMAERIVERFELRPPSLASEEGAGRGERFRVEGKGVIDTEGGLDRCTGCGQLPPHAGCKAICAACAPPTGACDCPGCALHARGFRAGIEAAAKECDSEITALTSQGAFINHATLVPSQIARRIRALSPPAPSTPAPATRCGAVHDSGPLLICDQPAGHAGDHRQTVWFTLHAPAPAPVEETRVIAVCWKCRAPLADTLAERGSDGYSCKVCRAPASSSTDGSR